MPHATCRLSRRGLLTATVGSLLLAACGGGNPTPSGAPTATPGSSGILGILPAPSPTPTPQPTKVRFAHWLQDVAAPVMTSLVAAFNHSHQSVVVQEEVQSFGEHIAALRQGFAAGNPPDVFLISGPDLVDQAAAKTLLDLTSLVNRDSIDLTRFWTSPQTRAIGGQQLALPLWCEVDLIYVNHDLFGKAQVGSLSADWTWSDLLATASKLTVGKPGEVTQWGLLIVNDIQGGWGGFVSSNGGRWLDATTGKTALAGPAVDALQWVVDAINQHHVAPGPRAQAEIAQGGTVDPFLDGKVGMFVNGTWEMPQLLTSAHFPWDVLPLPRAPKTNQSASVADAQPGAIARASSVGESAWEFLGFLVSTASQRVWAHNKVRLPSLVSVAADASAGYATTPPTRAASVGDALTSAQDLEFRANWQAFRNALTVGLQPAFDGDQPLGDVLPVARTAADKALGAPP